MNVLLVRHGETTWNREGRYQGRTDIPLSLKELIKLRASMLNGCAYCIEMHAEVAMKHGDSPQRLLALAAPLFALVLMGYVVMRLSGWTAEVAESLSKFVFVVALPAMMFVLRIWSSSLVLPWST